MIPEHAFQPLARPPEPVAVVTGAGRRIGASIARHLHDIGYDVAIHYRSSTQDALSLVQALNALRTDSAIAIEADLTDIDQCSALIDRTLAWRGRLDALINNASSFRRTPFGNISANDWHELIDGNLKSTLFCSQAAKAALSESSGAIVNLCDAHTDRPLPEFSVYSAAKAAIVALTRSLALELAPAVRVNAVSPGSLDWPEDDTIFSAEERRSIQAAIPLQRLGDGRDIAEAVQYLLQRAAYVTGHVLVVDGGARLVSH